MGPIGSNKTLRRQNHIDPDAAETYAWPWAGSVIALTRGAPAVVLNRCDQSAVAENDR